MFYLISLNVAEIGGPWNVGLLEKRHTHLVISSLSTNGSKELSVSHLTENHPPITKKRRTKK